MKPQETENTKHSPPKWARQLLRLFCAASTFEEVDGDLLEEYHHQLRRYGFRKAYWDYVINVITFIQPFAGRREHVHHTPPLVITNLWRNYLTTAVRNFARNRTYSVLNLTGLTLGLVSSMLIFQYVTFENTADRFHVKGDQLYRVAFKSVVGGGTPETFSQIFLGAAEEFKATIPAVENFVRVRADFFQEGPTITYTSGGDKIAFKDIRSVIVDSTFLEVFTFPLVKGDQRTALRLPNSVVITESMAQRLFGDEDPIGKTIDYSMNLGLQNLLITGIMQDIPANSHLQFDVVIPLSHFMASIPEENRQYYEPWEFREFTTYVELRPDTDVKKVEQMMTKVVDRNIGEDLREQNITVNVVLQPMKSLYFDRQTDLGTTGFGSTLVSARTGNQRMTYFFTIIAIITLAIALISYINLSTVRSLDRAKEVGIRKVVGAHKYHLKIQFFMESVLMNLTALLIAILVVIMLIPCFNEFAQTNFTLASWFNQTFLLVFGTIFVSGVLLSGLYPAFILSSFMPIAALKGSINSFGSRSALRKFFVVLQYAPAIALIVCTIIVYNQLGFMRNMDVGLEMNKLITIRSARFLPDGMRSRDAEAMFRNEINKLSAVAGASFAGNQAGRGLNFIVPFGRDTTNESSILEFKASGVDHDFADVFGLKLLAGQPFTEGMSPNHGDPEKFIRKVLVNETAVRQWGFDRNDNVVGHVITSTNGSQYYIQGVLEDFNWASAHNATEPVMLWYTPNNRFMTIRLEPEADVEEALAQLKGIYDRLFPEDVFHYEFAEDVYNKQYSEDEKFANLFGIFSGMSILIASLGLFGLSAFAAERRSKEVGIRKVMGANVNQIVRLLSKEFVFLVFIAFVVASPIAWIVMREWLQTFAFHIELNAIPFIVTAIGSVCVATATVSVKCMSVANTNPIHSLRTE